MFYRYCGTGKGAEDQCHFMSPLQRLSSWLAEGRDAVRSPTDWASLEMSAEHTPGLAHNVYTNTASINTHEISAA